MRELQETLQEHPSRFPRFVLPDGNFIPAHAHLTEVSHVVRNFIDCGGMTGQEEKIVLQMHVGDDKEHRLRSDRFAKILQFGNRVIPSVNLDIDVEYDCCVVAQYPIAELQLEGNYLDLMLQHGQTQCRARERREAEGADCCCQAASACC
jgi:uncharacterized protein DUF6428